MSGVRNQKHQQTPSTIKYKLNKLTKEVKTRRRSHRSWVTPEVPGTGSSTSSTEASGPPGKEAGCRGLDVMSKYCLMKAEYDFQFIALSKFFTPMSCMRNSEEANLRISWTLRTMRQMSLDSINKVRGVPDRDVNNGLTLLGSEMLR